MGSKKIVRWLLILVTFDQAVKIIINSFFRYNTFKLIDGIIGFRPTLNTKGSWANSQWGLGISFTFLIIINIIFIPFIIEIYRFYRHSYMESKIINASYLLILSGAVCSLLDKVCWGGSLDFISVWKLFVSDTKDIYLTAGVTLLVIEMLISGELKPQKAGNLKESGVFFKYVLNDIRSLRYK